MQQPLPETEFILVRSKQDHRGQSKVAVLKNNGTADLSDYIFFRLPGDKAGAMDKYVHRDDFDNYVKLFNLIPTNKTTA